MPNDCYMFRPLHSSVLSKLCNLIVILQEELNTWNNSHFGRLSPTTSPHLTLKTEFYLIRYSASCSTASQITLCTHGTCNKTPPKLPANFVTCLIYFLYRIYIATPSWLCYVHSTFCVCYFDRTCEIKCRTAMAKAAFNKKRAPFTSTLDLELRKKLVRVKEQRNILHEIRKRKANWIGHILRRNCLLQRVIEEKIKGGIEVTGRRGRKRRKLLDDLKERRGYSHLKKEALDHTMWRA